MRNKKQEKGHPPRKGPSKPGHPPRKGPKKPNDK